MVALTCLELRRSLKPQSINQPAHIASEVRFFRTGCALVQRLTVYGARHAVRGGSPHPLRPFRQGHRTGGTRQGLARAKVTTPVVAFDEKTT